MRRDTAAGWAASPLSLPPARRSEAGPVLPGDVVLASRLGLGRPLRRTPGPWQDPGRPPTRREVSGHYPAFAATTSHLTPRRASAGVSPCGLSHRLPSGPLGPTGPYLDHRPPAHLLARLRTTEPLGPDEAQIIPMALSPPASRNHPLMLHRQRTVPVVSACTPRRWGHRLPCCALGRHIRRPSSGSLSFRPTALPPPPSDPPSSGRPGHRLLELQRPKLGKDSHLLVIETAGRTRVTRGPGGPLVAHSALRPDVPTTRIGQTTGRVTQAFYVIRPLPTSAS
jgi:hypothetical protein